MKKMIVMYDVSGSVIVDELSSETGFSSQYHPDGHLLTFFPDANGVVVTRTGGAEPASAVTSVRHGKVYRTVVKMENES